MNEIVTYRAAPAGPQQFDVSDMERMARALAGSKLFGIQTPEQALALCLIAQAEGRHPASAAADYHIIQGRPSKKAEAMLRDFLGAGGKVEWHKLDDTIADATFSHPNGGSARIAWDHARVKQAGIRNDMHAKYPRQMLRSRTVSEGVRTVFPAATSGMYVPEEAEAMEPMRNVTPPRPAPAPKLAHPEPEPTPFDDEAAAPQGAADATPFDDDAPEGNGRTVPKTTFVAKWAAEARERIAACQTPDDVPALMTWWSSPANTKAIERVGREDAEVGNAVKAEVKAARDGAA